MKKFSSESFKLILKTNTFFLFLSVFASCNEKPYAIKVNARVFSLSFPTPYLRAEWVGDTCGYWYTKRSSEQIDFIVIHTCEMPFYECWSYLKSCHTPSSSAHYVVQSNDGYVVQLVDEFYPAWHATCLNPVSIGIEHEGYSKDGKNWFSDALYCSSASLTRYLAEKFSIPLDREHIIGHNEANLRYCGGNHTDPGPSWDWNYYMMLVKNGCDPCQLGEKKCSLSGNYVEVCDFTGMTWTTVQHCPHGCLNGKCK